MRGEMRPTLTLATGLLLGGCALVGSAPGPETLAGYYASGFETEAFYPCGSDERWWVTQVPPEMAAHYRAVARPYETVFVRVEGEAGPRGDYGHLGAYARELRITKLLSMDAPGQGACE